MNFHDIAMAAKMAENSVNERFADVTSALGYSRKNLIKTTAGNRTTGGVTATPNGDGSFTLNGSTNSTIMIYHCLETGEVYPPENPRKMYKNGRYIISGGNYKVRIQMFQYNEETDYKIDYSGEFEVTDRYAYNRIRMVVLAGSSFDNEIVFPMLRNADISDDTYEPYKQTVAEYIADFEARISALENKGGN